MFKLCRKLSPKNCGARVQDVLDVSQPICRHCVAGVQDV